MDTIDIEARTTKKKHLTNVWPVLTRRVKRWANIGQTLDQCLVFAGGPLKLKR